MNEPELYRIRISGHVGVATLRAFPDLRSETRGGDTVLTGRLRDQAALFGVIGQIERLGLELIEISGGARTRAGVRSSPEEMPWRP